MLHKTAMINRLSVFALTLCLTACGTNETQEVATLPLTDEVQPVVVDTETDSSKTTEEETTVSATDIQAIATTETVPEDVVTTANYTIQDIENWARNFAHSLYTDIANTDVNDAVIIPISTEHEIGTFDVDAMLADIFLIDVNYDGVPEFFAGGHGTMGSGRYSVYDTDGNCHGTEIFTTRVRKAHSFRGGI